MKTKIFLSVKKVALLTVVSLVNSVITFPQIVYLMAACNNPKLVRLMFLSKLQTHQLLQLKSQF